MSTSELTQIFEELKDGVRRGDLKPRTQTKSRMSRMSGTALSKIRRLRTKGAAAQKKKLLEALARGSLIAREFEARALAYRVFGDEKKAEAWLHRPNASLSGQVPFDLLNDELGAAVVRETLEQIDHGIFA
jgi:putative toxin-antitoxin system antitoxin component (TIGR02293 family)